MNAYYSVDKTPDDTQRRALAFLVAAERPVSRRKVQQHLFGDRWGAGPTIAALRALQDRKLAESAYDRWTGTKSRLWKATPAGAAALALAEAMDEAS